MNDRDRALDPEIRSAWRDARAAEPPAWFAAAVGSAVRSTPQHRRARWDRLAFAGIAAAAAIVAVAVVFGGDRDDDGVGPRSSPTATATASVGTPTAPASPTFASPAPRDDVLPGAWRPTADPPIGGRTGHVLVWTGTEMLVWGGAESTREVTVFDDVRPSGGAAYDPMTDRWRPIPDAPIAGRYQPLAAWTGRELIVWGGWGPPDSVADGAAYDPVTDRWRLLPPAPLNEADAVGGWVGGRFVVVTSDGVAAYDPLVDGWAALDPAPIRPGWRSAAIAADRLAVIAYGDGASGVVEGAILDPTTEQWQRIPVPLVPLDAGLDLRAAGGAALAAGAGQRLDPAAASWTAIARCDGVSVGGAWTGRYLLSPTSAYDAVADVCLDLPTAPRRAPPFDNTSGREFAVGVWTGEAYVTWSGGTGGDIVWVPDDGAIFRPSIDLSGDR